MYFCKNTRGFFDSSLGHIPKDAVEISDELHLHLLEEQAKGGSLKVGKEGLPYVAIAEEPTQDFLKNICKKYADKLLAATDWSQIHDARNACKNIEEFDLYRAKIRELRVTPEAEPKWPTQPKPVWSFTKSKGD